MKDYDYLMTIPMLVYLLIKSISWGNTIEQVLSIFLLGSVMWLGFCALVLRWPKRYKDHEHGKALLALPQKKVTGYIADLRSYDTGKKSYISVSDGTTMEIGGDWSIYEHSHMETYPVYDGDILSLTSVRNGKPFMKFRTLPSYVDGAEHKLRYYHNSIEVTYITDTDGTNYCLAIQPIEEA